MKDYKQFLNRTLLFSWSLAFAFFFGQLIWYIVPLSWPFNVVTGYAIGAIASMCLAWLVFNKMSSVATRITLAAVSLVFVGAMSISINHLTNQTSIMRAEIQELRDNQQHNFPQ